MRDHPESENLDVALAQRLLRVRTERGWSLDDLADASGVSRATLSRIERGETSPTAHVLGRLSAAYGVTISTLLAALDEAPARVLPRRLAQHWRDPENGFERWAISPPMPGYAIELVWSELPPGVRIDYPAPAYAGMEQHIAMYEGELRFEAGDDTFHLRKHDCLRVKLHGRSAFHNCGRGVAKYLIAVRSSP